MSSGLLSAIGHTRELLVGLLTGLPDGELSLTLKLCEMRGCCPTCCVEALASLEFKCFVFSFFISLS